MASVRKEIETKAQPDDAWAAIEDIGALHTRLVPGFVIDTRVEPGARVVTFGNGVILREPIVTIDPVSRRLVWTAEGGRTNHYNASIQVFQHGDEKTIVVWIADFLPDTMANNIAVAMEAGMDVMKKTLDKLAR
jgi:carbon monoxide dehydrogenase subunit G